MEGKVSFGAARSARRGCSADRVGPTLSPRKVPGYGSFRYRRMRVQCVLEEVVMIRGERERNFSRTTDEDERRARDSPVAEEDSSAESDPGWKRHRISN